MVSRGFTVVEILVALVVFSVGLLGVVAGAGWGLSLLNDGRIAERGVVHAADVLDSLMEAESISEGEREWSAGRIEWSIEPTSPLTRVTVHIHDRRRGETPVVIGAIHGPP